MIHTTTTTETVIMTSVLLEGAGDHDGVYINDNVGNTFNSLHLFIILLPSLSVLPIYLYFIYLFGSSLWRFYHCCL